MEELLAVARRSPLTRLIEAHVPSQGIVLEAGCGLGQYVLHLRELGHRAVGADWSLDALRAGRAPLVVMDLRALAARILAPGGRQVWAGSRKGVAYNLTRT